MTIRLLHIKLLLTAFIALLSLQLQAQCASITPGITPDQTFFCGVGPHTINFTNSTSGVIPPPVTFDWYQNGTLIGTTNNVATPFSQSITAVGTYNFMLVVNNPTIPCSDTSYANVTIAPTPNADFTFTPDGGCAFQDVNFINASTGTYSATTYNWNFNPGTSVNEDPTYQFNGGGTYNVTLTVDNGSGCISTSTQSVTVIDAPVASISGDDGDGDLVYCLFPGDNTTSETVTFSNLSTNAISYEWDFGDGSPLFTTASLANFTHDYTSYGTFNVTMTATHANGCQTVTTLVVIFEKFVSASMTLDLTEYSGCTPHDMSTLVNLSVNATNYVWDFGDGTVITTNTPLPPAYAYSAAGNYTISLTASNSCNSATATISPIIIIDGPTASFNPSVTNGCAPQSISFNNTSQDTQPANNYQWDMGNGNTYINTTIPPIQVYPTTGTYTIELIAGNACGNDTIIQTIVIDTIPTVELILDPITGCSPLIVDPTASLLSGNNVNWQWYIDGGYYSNAPNDIPNQNFISMNSNDSTEHTIQVNVSNICGSDSDIQSVFVHPPVIAEFTTLDTICLGDLSTFTNTSTGTELTYSWDFGDGSPLVNDTNTTHLFTTAGNYTISLTTTGVCGSDTYTFVISVLEIPFIDFTPSSSDICSGESISITNNSSSNGNYFWEFGSNGSPSTSTLFNPGNVTFTGSGQQTISFTINYAGCAASDTVYIDVNPIPVADFSISPNSGCTPVSTTITNNTIDNPGNNYSWDYGNGNTSNMYLPTNQVYLGGTLDTNYTVQLIVETLFGCIDTLEQTVLVSPLPLAQFTILDDTICLGDAMLFANNSTGASSYLWDFGDGTTTGTISPSHTYISHGDFQVSLVAYSTAGCTDTALIDVYVDSIPTATFINTIECFGNLTTFSNTSTGSPVAYTWDFGDGSPNDNSVNPTHLYSSSGSYLVTLTATNSVNCSNSAVQLVQVNDVPIADFSWSQTCDGQSMIFTDASLNSPIGWAWDFDDGNTSLVQSPSHLFSDTGSYSVQLIVSVGSGCLDSITIDVYVDSIPQSDFNFTSVCTNDEMFFIDNSNYSPNSYVWQFGDGNSSILQNPSHTYTTAGNYDVTLTVEYTSNGCTHAFTQNVEAYPRTVPTFNANTPCLGEMTDFVDATINTPITWEWNFDDGSPVTTSQNPSHLFSTQGLYNISLITSNIYGCYDTLIQQIEIYGLPIADFTHTIVCEGAVTQFYDNSIDDVSWQWDFGDLGFTSLTENPIHTFSSNGTFITELVVFNAVGCTDTIEYPITVNPNPIAGFTVDTACFGYITSFNDISIDAVSWIYDFGDLNTSSLSDPTHTYPNDGFFTSQQTVTNIFGCKDSISIDVLIHPQPDAGFINTTVCAQDVVNYTDTTIGNINYWNWDFGDGSAPSNDQDPTHEYNVGGSYTVTLIAGNTSGCLDTNTRIVEVYTNPIADFEADTVCFLEVTSFIDLSTDAVPITSWNYDFGDNINQSTLQNPTYIYQAPGLYPASLIVTNINGCDDTVQINVVVNNIPVANFNYDTVCWGSPTTFTDISTGSVNSWNWDFGDGSTSANGPIETHIYANPGTYLASMEVDGGTGCTDIIYYPITVIEVLTPIIGAQDTACLMETIQFQDLSVTTSGSITGWLWSFGDGNSSTLQNPIHSYSNSGVYSVTLDVTTSTGCVNTGTYTLEVFNPPTNDFTFTIPCEGQPTIFTDNSLDNNGLITSWEWDFGDGSAIDNSSSPQHQYALAGNYNVSSIILSTNGCYDTLTQVVTIYPSPTADFIFSTECGGLPVDLINTSNGNITDYEWIYDGQIISTDENTSFSFPTDTDTHPTTLVVTTDLGCIDSLSQDVITKPIVTFDYGPNITAGCPVLEVSFFENSTTTGGGGIVNWLWNMGDSTYSFNANPIHYYEDSGTYYISLQVITAEDCIYYDTLTYAIIVYPQPTAGFIYSPHEISILNPEVKFTNTSIGAQDVEWHFGDFDYSNDWNPTHLYNDTGYFEVTQTVYNAYGCSDTISQFLYIRGDLVLYVPNTFTPNGDGMNDFFNMSGYGFESFELLIFNRWGNVVKTITDINDSWDGTFNGRNCQDGVYTWKLRAIDFDEIPHQRVGHVSILR